MIKKKTMKRGNTALNEEKSSIIAIIQPVTLETDKSKWLICNQNWKHIDDEQFIWKKKCKNIPKRLFHGVSNIILISHVTDAKNKKMMKSEEEEIA